MFERVGHDSQLAMSGLVLCGLMLLPACGASDMHVSGGGHAGQASEVGQAMWTSTGELNTGRSYATSLRLDDGRVMILGSIKYPRVASVEVYAPAAGVWTEVQPLSQGRYPLAATVIGDGRVMVFGPPARYAEIYDRATDTWTATPASLAVTRGTLTTLLDGRVLLVGTFGDEDKAEIYDLASSQWTATAPLARGHMDHSATRLLDGRVLIAGGYESQAEIYDPTSDTWTVAGASFETRRLHSAALLDDGRVLLAGGSMTYVDGTVWRQSLELFHPDTGEFMPGPGLAWPRHAQGAAKLTDGRVLLAGGIGPDGALASCELFDPATGLWSSTASMLQISGATTLTRLSDGAVLAAGGGTSNTSSEIWSEIVQGAVCGNAQFEGDEQCDDGNTELEECDYGLTSCDVCDPQCQIVPGATSYCGDDIIDEANGELCDGTDGCGEDCQPSAALLPFVEDFESGALGPAWQTDSTGAGRIRVISSNAPHGGSHHLAMDSATNSVYSRNKAVLMLDLEAASHVVLAFFHKEFYDEDHTLPPSFWGSANGDAVAISADGNNWFKVQGLTSVEGITSAWRRFEVDLDAAVASAGISYGSRFFILFQQYDNYQLGTDGFAFDDIEVYEQDGTLPPPPPGEASYDAVFAVPACTTTGPLCDSAALVDGRYRLGPEPNFSNTLDGCADGTYGHYHSDESLDRLLVQSADGGPLRPGVTARVEATVWAWSSGSSDHLDVFYARDATRPVWERIATLTPAAGGQARMSTQFTLGSGGPMQAIRGQFRYNGAPTPCFSGGYNDRDDLVFAVE